MVNDNDADGLGNQVNATLAHDSLKAADRCDRCGAQAYVRITLASGDLLFCGHHAKQYDTALRKVAIEIQDETTRISES